MGRRKKQQDEHENLERWLVSYADFMTLLFAFFVVMYSISSVNEGKYRVLSDSLRGTFNKDMASEEVINFKNPLTQVADVNSDDFIELPIPSDKKKDKTTIENNPTLDEIENEVSGAVTELIDQGLISLNNNDNWLEIEIKSSILFQSGGARLSEEAEDVLARLANIIKTYPNQIQVEGYTDNIPIKTISFPSNWELSSSRAASVVHLFANEGVTPNHMQAIGYGEYRPKKTNSTEEGRSENRRVVLVILGSENSRKVVKSEAKNTGGIKNIESNPIEYDAKSTQLINF
ncbi:MAG: flagellar motor protein MotD [Pseudomonadota bacterium]